MAKRSSGQVNVDIKYIDSRDQYRAVVSVCGGRGQKTQREVVYVGPPKFLERAVDHPAAYDAAARAAITFAGKIDAMSHADVGWNGVHIARKARNRRC